MITHRNTYTTHLTEDVENKWYYYCRVLVPMSQSTTMHPGCRVDMWQDGQWGEEGVLREFTMPNMREPTDFK